jgi:hypothetical protein
VRALRPSLLALASLLLTGSCALFTGSYRPPRAPKSEAERVKFPWGSPRETVRLTGVWLRAVTMALDDFIPEQASELADKDDPMAVCLSRRDSYDVNAFVWTPDVSDAGEADAGEWGLDEMDGGSAAVLDAGPDLNSYQPGRPKNPPVIYVQITLAIDCNPGGGPIMDWGALYAIDTVNWRILAINH